MKGDPAMSIFADLGVRDGKDRAKEGLLYNLAACYALLDKEITQALAPYGLSPVKMNALLMVRHIGQKEGMSQVEIGKRMIVSPGNITRLIDRLEKDKMVERLAKTGDKRVKLICITKKASDLLGRVWPIYKKKVEDVIALSGAEVLSASDVLSGLRRKLLAKGANHAKA